MSRVFAHSGDIGDIIYALPVIRACGGGELHLFDSPGKTAHGMNEAKVESLRPLLVLQPYITSLHWSPGCSDHAINGFRDHMVHGNLADAHLATMGMGWEERATKWIEVDEPDTTYEVVFSRSPRYHNRNFDWHRIVKKYQDKACFIGLQSEYEDFCRNFGAVPKALTRNYLEIARYIAGAKLFVGNQSSPCAVAHAMKSRMIMEICPHPNASHHCVFQRMDCIIGWDGKVELPEL